MGTWDIIIISAAVVIGAVALFLIIKRQATGGAACCRGCPYGGDPSRCAPPTDAGDVPAGCEKAE